MAIPQHRTNPTLEELRAKDQAYKALSPKEKARLTQARKDFHALCEAFGGTEIAV